MQREKNKRVFIWIEEKAQGVFMLLHRANSAFTIITLRSPRFPLNLKDSPQFPLGWKVNYYAPIPGSILSKMKRVYIPSWEYGSHKALMIIVYVPQPEPRKRKQEPHLNVTHQWNLRDSRITHNFIYFYSYNFKRGHTGEGDIQHVDCLTQNLTLPNYNSTIMSNS